MVYRAGSGRPSGREVTPVPQLGYRIRDILLPPLGPGISTVGTVHEWRVRVGDVVRGEVFCEFDYEVSTLADKQLMRRGLAATGSVGLVTDIYVAPGAQAAAGTRLLSIHLLQGHDQALNVNPADDSDSSTMHTANSRVTYPASSAGGTGAEAMHSQDKTLAQPLLDPRVHAARIAAARALVAVRERTGKPISQEIRRLSTAVDSTSATGDPGDETSPL